MSQAFRAAIRELTDTFATDVLQALRSASLEEIRSKTSDSSDRKRGPVAARPSRTERPSRRVPPSGQGRGRAKKSGEGADTLLDKMVAVLRKHPQGLRSEQLRALLKADKVPFRLVAQEAVAADLITRTGEKRATTFAPK